MVPCDTNKDQQEEQQYSNAVELALSPVLPFVMKAVVELQVLDTIARLSPSQIASRLPASAVATTTSTLVCNPDAPEMLDRMLRLLASYSILTCSVVDLHSDDHDHDSSALATLVDRRLYGLTPLAKYFVPDQDGVSLAPLLCLTLEKAFVDSWYQLKGAVLEGGIPFHKVHGKPAFEYLWKDPMFSEVFNKTMIDHSTIVNKKIFVSSYKGFEQVQKLVDVGGGLGATLNLITSKNPHIKAINFDLPHIIQQAPPYPSVEHVGGDMFESVPKGDAILMKVSFNLHRTY
jgi:hypothetical protein